MLAACVIHLGNCGGGFGHGLGRTMVRAARGGGHRRRAAFRALRVAKGYDSWCKRTRGRRQSLPRAVEVGAAVQGGRRRWPAEEAGRHSRAGGSRGAWGF
jgi:hypothetical protein